MTNTLHHAKITPHRSAARGHSNHGWLDTYHSFSFANWYNSNFTHFGALRVLNEDRVKPNSGFPTHPHRDFEIFSYILSGELTHTDSTHKQKQKQKGDDDAHAQEEEEESELFCRVRRGDIQFTTAGTGVTHSEFNRGREPVHFLQIWAIPWKRGLAPRYDWGRYSDGDKRKGFVSLLSPLKGGADTTAEQDRAAEPTIPGTIAIHADFVMAAGIIEPGGRFEWIVGANAAAATKRKVYVHLPMTKGGRARIRLDGREDGILAEGDGAFVDGVNSGDRLVVESVGDAEAEVVVLDTA
jgi:redox-sensitive bicupin YhaK (pirin superfamily)